MITTAFKMTGGTDDQSGVGKKWDITYVGGVPTAGEKFNLVITENPTGIQYQIGSGDASGITPTYAYTYHSKVYLLESANVIMSAIDKPTKFNDPNETGNGKILLKNQFGTPEDLIAMAPFQGKLAFFSRNTTQLWNVDADPDNWSLHQLLQNIGTIAKLSVQPKGDLDVLFLADTGVRSLRARESTLNAFVDDIGSPIDSLVTAKVLANPSDAPNSAAIVEPTSGRYMLFLKDTIYVLSYFPSAKVAAWSTYEPTDDSGTPVTFVVNKFVVYKGQVFAWDKTAAKVYQYGGTDNNSYDSTVATLETPWLDLKTPGTIKTAQGINAAFTGTWNVSISMDPVAGDSGLESRWSSSDYTFDRGLVPVQGFGSHVKFKAVSSGSGAAVFSALMFHYQPGDEV